MIHLDTLEKLNALSMNYWWSWNQKTWNIFSNLNTSIWEETRNPILVLKNTPLLESKLTDTLRAEIDEEYFRLESYLARGEKQQTWFTENFKNFKGPIAYFSAEFGIHDSLPIYSGGLGVLSGDHVKSASDLGLPMIFVGLFYSNGYFIQKIDENGKQLDQYGQFDPNNMSLIPVTLSHGSRWETELQLADRTIKIWASEARVGTSRLFLLDSNHPENSEIDRLLTAKLYGGDREMRISQEIILGIGGVKLLNDLKIEPEVFHMNEGHSGFFQLERIRQTMKAKKLNFKEAQLLCASNCVFTTHTPVPAGNEAFSLPLMHKYFYKFIREFDISWRRFVELGLVPENSDYKFFSLTVFAINVSRFYNGVSELHGKIAKKMWRDAWPEVPLSENPMQHVTNGIHVQTWMALQVKELLSKRIGSEWETHLADQDFWSKISEVDNSEIRETKVALKSAMIALVRSHLKLQLTRNHESAAEVQTVDQYLNEKTLIIGFARRFATYKRATLIFKDPKKLAAIVNNPEKPVAFIFSGKAHPQDVPGQKFIQEIYKYSRQPEFKGKIIILENYDMNISRHMVAGCDVWLNNPRRPLEASGTSGQKVPINFGLNFSVLDGWWRESFDGNNGWSIGEEKDFENDQIQDFEDAQDFYKTLTQTILPLYYQDSTKSGLQSSEGWIDKTKASFITNIAKYSTHRMVQDYMRNFYVPAQKYGQKFQNSTDLIRQYLENRQYLKMNWDTIYFTYIHFEHPFVELNSKYNETFNTSLHHVEFPLEETLPGRAFETSTNSIHLGIYLGDIPTKAVGVEVLIYNSQSQTTERQKMYLKGALVDGVAHYGFDYKPAGDMKNGRLRFRVFGTDEFLNHPFEYSFMMWY